VDADQRYNTWVAAGEEYRPGRIQSEPAKPRRQAPKQNEDAVVAGHCGRCAIKRVFPPPGAKNPSDCQRGDTPHCMERSRPAGVEVSAAEAVRRAEAGEPPTTPDPVRDQGISPPGEKRGRSRARGEPPPLSAR